MEETELGQWCCGLGAAPWVWESGADRAESPGQIFRFLNSEVLELAHIGAPLES